jgi:hypothetical protein
MQSLAGSSREMDQFCSKWKLTDLCVNRSADVASDVLCMFARFDPTANWLLVDRLRMQTELQDILGTPVLIQSRHAEELRSRRPRKMQAVYNA